MSNNAKLKYEFELDNIDKPLSKSDLSQKIQEEKKETTLVNQLSDPDTKAFLRIISIASLPLIMMLLVLTAFNFIPDLISGKMQIFDIIKMIITFLSLPAFGYMIIITNMIISSILCKKNVKNMENNPNYVVNKELKQLNNCLVNKNEPYEIRYLHELIKENKYITYLTTINEDDNTAHLVIEVDDKFKKLNPNDYSNQDLELINQFNTHYKLNTNKDSLYFFEHNVNQYIDKDVLDSRFDAQSLQELHDKTEKIKNLAQRN